MARAVGRLGRTARAAVLGAGAVVGVMACTIAGCVSQPRYSGPMPVRNQHPAQLTVMHMPPASTQTLPAGRLTTRFDAAYSSLFLSGIGLARSFAMDGEYLRFGPTLRTGLGGGFELGVELPFAHTTGGFLDSFLIQYHDVFALPDQDRESVTNDNFQVTAVRDGSTVWQVEKSGIELLDVPIWLTYELLEPESGLGLAVRTGLELPTGDEETGYGSGEIDWSVGVLLERHFESVALYGQAQHTFAGTPSIARRGGLEFQDVTSIALGIEMPLLENLHAFTQVEFETSTLRDLGLRTTEREQVLIWAGGRYGFGAEQRCAIEFGIGEDLRGYASPDVTVWLGFRAMGL